jgi:hypothetical protein
MMRRPGTASVVAVRLLLAATIVASAGPLPSFANVASANGETLTETDAPALPSSFCGGATLDGADLADAADSCLS